MYVDLWTFATEVQLRVQANNGWLHWQTLRFLCRAVYCEWRGDRRSPRLCYQWTLIFFMDWYKLWTTWGSAIPTSLWSVSSCKVWRGKDGQRTRGYNTKSNFLWNSDGFPDLSLGDPITKVLVLSSSVFCFSQMGPPTHMKIPWEHVSAMRHRHGSRTSKTQRYAENAIRRKYS